MPIFWVLGWLAAGAVTAAIAWRAGRRIGRIDGFGDGYEAAARDACQAVERCAAKTLATVAAASKRRQPAAGRRAN